MRSASGRFGRPGIRIMSPVRTTRNPAPALIWMPVRVVIGDCEQHPQLGASAPDDVDLLGGVVAEAVQGDHRLLAEVLNVLDVLLEVREAPRDVSRIRACQRILLGAAVQLERTDGRDQHDDRGIQVRLPTLDVEELLGPQVEAEAGFGDRPVRQVHRHTGRDDAVAAVRDVGERAAVHEGRHALQRLDEVRPERVPQQHQHRARGRQLLGGDRLASVVERHEQPVDPRSQVALVLRQAEHGHHFRGCRDIEARLPRHALLVPTQSDEGVAQGAVVHVHDPTLEHAPRIRSGAGSRSTCGCRATLPADYGPR